MSRSDDEEFELFRQEMNDVTPLVGDEVADFRTAFEPTLAQKERRRAAEAGTWPCRVGRRPRG